MGKNNKIIRERKLRFIKEYDKLNILELSQEKVFTYFFFSKRKILFIVNDRNQLLGIITISDFLDNWDDVNEAVNREYLFIMNTELHNMFFEAEEIYEKHGIQTDIPVVTEQKVLIGYITDQNLFSAGMEEYCQQIEEAKDKIERFKKSIYLKKEIGSFFEVLSGTKIFAKECKEFHEIFSLFEDNIEVAVLDAEEYLERVKDLAEKTEIILDFEIGNRQQLYNRCGIHSIYSFERFMYEFSNLVENEEFSRIIRITKSSGYRLKQFISDNGMENIVFASNKLLTRYVYDYMMKNSIPVSLEESDYTAAIQVSCLVNGVRGNRKDCIGFTYCDLAGQQKSMDVEKEGKSIHVFHVKGAVNAKLTECETQRVKSFGRLERLIEDHDHTALNQLYGDDCKDKTPIQYAKEIYYSYPVKRRFENDIIVNVDYKSTYVNFENGIRKTFPQPEKYINTIYFYGPCFALGSFVEDRHTIPSLLSQKLIENRFLYRVVNLGMLAANDSKELMEHLLLRDGDIIVNLVYTEKSENDENIIDPSDAFNRIQNREEMFFDKSVHCNRKGNEIYADVIFGKIKGALKRANTNQLRSNNIYDIFKTNFNDLHLYEIQDYLNMLYHEKERIPDGIEHVGSIVMNCNPFTLGHKYLVEYALQKCEYLIVFVVQEDKSFFKFKDRFAIAQDNCKSYKNVSVIPSGNMIVSDISFPEYFKREAVRDSVGLKEDIMVTPVLDFRLFASYIAPVLGIKQRFIAEEPLDHVTEQYNEYMKKVLSAFDIQVEEIPRKTLEDGEVISASKVRKMYKDRNFRKMKEMLPDCTYHYLMKGCESSPCQKS